MCRNARLPSREGGFADKGLVTQDVSSHLQHPQRLCAESAIPAPRGRGDLSPAAHSFASHHSLYGELHIQTETASQKIRRPPQACVWYSHTHIHTDMFIEAPPRREGRKEEESEKGERKRGEEEAQRGERRGQGERERGRGGEGNGRERNCPENSVASYLPSWQPTLHIPIEMKGTCVCQTLPFAFPSSSSSLLSERGIKPAASAELVNSSRRRLPGNRQPAAIPTTPQRFSGEQTLRCSDSSWRDSNHNCLNQ